jgi:hypothetical protein
MLITLWSVRDFDFVNSVQLLYMFPNSSNRIVFKPGHLRHPEVSIFAADCHLIVSSFHTLLSVAKYSEQPTCMLQTAPELLLEDVP